MKDLFIKGYSSWDIPPLLQGACASLMRGLKLWTDSDSLYPTIDEWKSWFSDIGSDVRKELSNIILASLEDSSLDEFKASLRDFSVEDGRLYYNAVFGCPSALEKVFSLFSTLTESAYVLSFVEFYRHEGEETLRYKILLYTFKEGIEKIISFKDEKEWETVIFSGKGE